MKMLDDAETPAKVTTPGDRLLLIGNHPRGFWNRFTHYISYEFLLRRWGWPNGGSIILGRAILSSATIYLFILLIREITNPDSIWFTFDWRELLAEIHDTLTWYGAILVAIYAGLYARFASQWTYLAGLYNQIKAAEIKMLSDFETRGKKPEETSNAMKKIAEWRAGFIEDAENLHLATKDSVAPIIYFWLKDDVVVEQYKKNTPNGDARYLNLKAAVDVVYNRLNGTGAK